MHMYYEGGYFMGGMHWIWWLLWLALIGVIMFYGWRRPSGQRRGPRETPHDMLKRRHKPHDPHIMSRSIFTSAFGAKGAGPRGQDPSHEHDPPRSQRTRTRTPTSCSGA